MGTASINYVTKYCSYLDNLVSLIEQLTVINEPTIHQVNILLESTQSLHKKTRKYIHWIIKNYKTY